MCVEVSPVSFHDGTARFWPTLHSILLSGWTPVYQSIHVLKNPSVASSFAIRNRAAVNTCVHVLGGRPLSTPLGGNQGAWLPDRMVGGCWAKPYSCPRSTRFSSPSPSRSSIVLHFALRSVTHVELMFCDQCNVCVQVHIFLFVCMWTSSGSSASCSIELVFLPLSGAEDLLLIKSNLLTFLSWIMFFVSCLRTLCLNLRSQKVSPVFSSKIFIVVHLNYDPFGVTFGLRCVG